MSTGHIGLYVFTNGSGKCMCLSVFPSKSHKDTEGVSARTGGLSVTKDEGMK